MGEINYDISCSESTFNSIKSDDRFLKMLILSRCVNGLKFCLKSFVDTKGQTGPLAAGIILNSVFFSSSVLYEGFLLMDRLANDFRDIDSFKNGFGVLLHDKNVRQLRDTFLNRMRNKFVFHFDNEVPQESLTNFKLPEYKFASGNGMSSGGMWFTLADEVVLNYLLQPDKDETDDELKKKYIKLLQDVSSIIFRFNESAEKLIAEVLGGMGFTVKFHE